MENKSIYATDKVMDRAVFDALFDVFVGGAYCQKAITNALKKVDAKRAPFVTSAFYGVLDNNVRLEKLISRLCQTPPSNASAIVLKIGMYYIREADMPPYAAVNRAVELSKQLNGVFSGFINAVLKKSIDYDPVFKNKLEEFSFTHNTPEWLCKMLISDYSENKAAALLDAKIPDETHIRPVKGRMTEQKFNELSAGLERTPYGCYCDKGALSRFKDGTVTIQSLSSVLAVQAYVKGLNGGKVLDLCAAPGGKSIYISELGDYDVTACDIYPHKIELIERQAKKLGAKITAMLNDAAVHNKEFDGKFDLVVCDCPCSGTGTLKTKPDIMIKRKASDLDDLTVLQTKILYNAANYVVAGGVLCYSTCSILKCENERIKERFLASHPDFTLIDETKLLPDVDNCDGFYIVRFKRAA